MRVPDRAEQSSPSIWLILLGLSDAPGLVRQVSIAMIESGNLIIAEGGEGERGDKKLVARLIQNNRGRGESKF